MTEAFGLWSGGREVPESELKFSLWHNNQEVDLGTPSSDPGYSISDLLSEYPFYVAHRCGGANWPEFSERGIINSIALGYQSLELSVWRCSTGEFVLSHDRNTSRVTGEDYDIPTTPWSVLRNLTSTAENTSNPEQSRTPLLRLTDAMSLINNRCVLWIDHKATAAKIGGDWEQQSLNALYDYLDTFPYGKDKFIHKTFKNGHQAAARARLRGYKTNCMYFAHEIAAGTMMNYEYYDIPGLNYDAPQALWNELLANSVGKKVIGHVITESSQRDTALLKGADGIMNSDVLGLATGSFTTGLPSETLLPSATLLPSGDALMPSDSTLPSVELLPLG